MVIYPLASSFSYDKSGDNYKGAKWIIDNLIDAVAKGGSFMVGIGPDGNGKFYPKAVEQLEETGHWLKVNGEGFYDTRARDIRKEGLSVFTQSKDVKRVYAFINDLSSDVITISSLQPRTGSEVRLLGYEKKLTWTVSDEGVKINIPEELQNGKNDPCKYMWTLKFEM